MNTRKKVDKKKQIQEAIKPEIISKYKQYVDFLFYVNLSNNFKASNLSFEKPYRLYVGKGNNGTLIKKLFRANRPWWAVE